MAKAFDRIGMKYGRLTVIRKGDGKRYGKSAVSIVTWHCRCECGNLIEATANGLGSGITKSCGCLRLDRLREAITTHGMTKHKESGKVTKEYRTWQNMKARCLNPKHRHYALYGGRGIGICERWILFAYFLEDMGVAPSDRHSIERIDNNAGYSQSNCKWATQKEQINNRRNTIFIECNGERLSSSDWSARSALPIKTITSRIKKGWEPERAIFCLSKPKSRKYLKAEL